MPTFVVPHRVRDAKRRLRAELPDETVVEAMLGDVLAACARLGPTLVADGPGGQGAAVAAALAGLPDAPVAVVNSDVPCATPDDLAALLAAVPDGGLALVQAPDGTTNALALARPGLFEPLYGPGSAARFLALAPSRSLDVPNLADDVDTLADLHRLRARLGPRTRAALEVAA